MLSGSWLSPNPSAEPPNTLLDRKIHQDLNVLTSENFIRSANQHVVYHSTEGMLPWGFFCRESYFLYRNFRDDTKLAVRCFDNVKQYCVD